jgi:Transcriptional regulator, AbiEi antitoxin
VYENFKMEEGFVRVIDRLIAEIAAKQHGNITRPQLITLGISDSGIAYRVRLGRLHRVFHGVYAVGHPPTSPIQRASAAVLSSSGAGGLSHTSAMVLWELWRHWEEPFEVVSTANGRTRDIRTHRSATHAWRDLKTHRGIRVTSPARTLLDMAPRLSDRRLKREVSNALHSPWLSEGHLVELLGRCGHLKSAARIAELVGLPGSPPRSGQEDDFPTFCRTWGLPDPLIGAPVCGLTVDGLFDVEKVIVELDSWQYHGDKIAFEVDRDRDATTLAAGFVTVRPTYHRLTHLAAREAARLHKILALRRAQAA